MITVNEKTTCALVLSFTDETGAAVTPSSGSYRIDDVDSGTQVLGDTAFTPTSATHSLVITAAQNSQISTNPSEGRRVTITWLYGSGKQGTAEHIYLLKNLPKLS